ncbi:hypothetical protein [Thermoflexus hugenholtzii]|jgi:hypothetical protein|uniref:Uncharacterized protein n=1 Tax=Thermoflexus hugenholtzii JAD2 TaxID=877466 RepID=A0A212R618_9CHLR|nr:hypothetical protein [Thermoflexus hugenholtzii]SNB67558.1 hypothetical protein SAMN02746019_00013430 [Thermoflexus hugenholtzii JAD2]
MRQIAIRMVGNLLGIGLALGLGLAMAWGAGAAAPAEESTLTPTPTLTPTVPVTRIHPVALALARWISQTFPTFGLTPTISVTDLMGLHAQGFGYGEIARALQLVLASQSDADPTNDLSLEQALQLGRQVGWGQAYRAYGLHPGGRGLGAIMRSARSRAFATPAPSPTPAAGPGSTSSKKPNPSGKMPKGRGR